MLAVLAKKQKLLFSTALYVVKYTIVCRKNNNKLRLFLKHYTFCQFVVSLNIQKNKRGGEKHRAFVEVEFFVFLFFFRFFVFRFF